MSNSSDILIYMQEIDVPPIRHETLPIEDGLHMQALGQCHAPTLLGLIDENRDYLVEFLPWFNKTKTVADARGFIEVTALQREWGNIYGYGIFARDQLVGHTAIMNIGMPDPIRPTEIGYWVSKELSGNGIITKAAGALTRFGLETLQQRRILIRAEPDNGGSNRVAAKLGYEFEAQIPDPEFDNRLMNYWFIRS